MLSHCAFWLWQVVEYEKSGLMLMRFYAETTVVTLETQNSFRDKILSVHTSCVQL